MPAPAEPAVKRTPRVSPNGVVTLKVKCPATGFRIVRLIDGDPGTEMPIPGSPFPATTPATDWREITDPVAVTYVGSVPRTLTYHVIAVDPAATPPESAPKVREAALPVRAPSPPPRQSLTPLWSAIAALGVALLIAVVFCVWDHSRIRKMPPTTSPSGPATTQAAPAPAATQPAAATQPVASTQPMSPSVQAALARMKSDTDRQVRAIKANFDAAVQASTRPTVPLPAELELAKEIGKRPATRVTTPFELSLQPDPGNPNRPIGVYHRLPGEKNWSGVVYLVPPIDKKTGKEGVRITGTMQEAVLTEFAMARYATNKTAAGEERYGFAASHSTGGATARIGDKGPDLVTAGRSGSNLSQPDLHWECDDIGLRWLRGQRTDTPGIVKKTTIHIIQDGVERPLTGEFAFSFRDPAEVKEAARKKGWIR